MRSGVRCIYAACFLLLLGAGTFTPSQAGIRETLSSLFSRDERPPRDYLILVNYELGMHCTGFDFAYCCILPPYNSILAQVVKTERNGKRPRLLGADPDDPSVLVDGNKRFRLSYSIEGPDGTPNSYSAPKKLVYWGVRYGGGQLPNHEFSNLYIYKDLEGSNPGQTTENARKLHVGLQTPIHLNQGPTGQDIGKGFLRYSGSSGTVVFTDSRVMENVPITLANPGIWEAVGLPLTPFNDDFTALITLDESMVQPFMKSVVTLTDADSGEPVVDSSGKVVRFFGVNPIDIPNCSRCHSNSRANGSRYVKYKEEYNFWRGIRGSSEWYAQLKAAAISILEIHDDHHGTNFLGNWPAGSSNNVRLGRDSVMCQDCHADNVIGRLKSRTVSEIPPGDVQAGHAGLPKPDHLISPLSEALHKVHLKKVPLADSHGFAGSCQLCHPAHRSDRGMERFPLTADGYNRFKNGDVRDSRGCYTQRDVHSNAERNSDGVETSSHLNAIGDYLLFEVMNDKGVDKGLYCTHCHNRLSRELYKNDHLSDAVLQSGKTLRMASLEKIAEGLGITEETLLAEYMDPRVPARGEDHDSGVYKTWDRTGQTIAPVARIKTGDNGKPALTTADEDGDRSVIIEETDPDGARGLPVSYDAATDGRDYWLSPGEPHCADCHAPPFVESMGGGAFPIDQPGKYALMRFSKGHGGITCQGCHESTHGLYPVNPTVDMPAYQQAALLNPDGSHGPVKCGACHRVNSKGIPSRHKDFIDKESIYWVDYEKSVELQHRIR